MNEPRRRRPLELVVAVALLAVTALVYHRVSGFAFVNYDDPALLVRNHHVNTGLSLANVAWAFTSTHLLQWAPVTWLTHMIDFQLFGSDPSGHHLTSLAFHLFNTVALLVLLRRATGDFWRSAFVAALFALHPLHVEPVAWLSARKDLVSTAGLLVALLAYVEYARRASPFAYAATLAAYAVSLMAKPMYVTLPVLLLLLDAWPLARMRATGATPSGSGRRHPLIPLVVEKLPFFGLAAVSSAVAYLTQARADAVVPFRIEELGSRAAGVVVAYATYVWKTVWPAGLAVVYPRPELPVWEVLVAIAFLAAVSVLAIRGARARPWLLVGWGWFLVALLPVIGIVQIGSSWVADKFTYVPLVGLFVMVAWGVPELVELAAGARARRPALAIAAGAALALLAARSALQLESWKDSITLYTRALEVTDGNFVVLGNLGYAYQEQGRLEEALRYYHESIRVEPRYDAGYASIGLLWVYGMGDCERAAPYLSAALRLNPAHRQAESALAWCGRR
jgi:hypothetical protein